MELNESKIQQDIIKTCWAELPVTRGLLFHVPNGGLRSGGREGAMLKGQGVLSGVPDLCFMWVNGANWIEVKKPGGILSKSQKALIALWGYIRTGSAVKVVYNSDDAISHIRNIITNHPIEWDSWQKINDAQLEYLKAIVKG